MSVLLPIWGHVKKSGSTIDEYVASLGDTSESHEVVLVVTGSRVPSERVAARQVNKGLRTGCGGFACYTNSARTRGADFGRVIQYGRANPGAMFKATCRTGYGRVRRLPLLVFTAECRLLVDLSV